MTAFPDIFQASDTGIEHGSRWFELASRFRHYSRYGLICVPKGFRTDGASIPRIFHSIIGPYGSYFPAAIVHDFLYRQASDEFYGDITRAMADRIFLDAMQTLSTPWPIRRAMWFAVRLAGWIPYKRKRK